MKARLPYYGTKKCDQTDLFLTIKWRTQYVKVIKEHAC